jgi:hypothetical protein
MYLGGMMIACVCASVLLMVVVVIAGVFVLFCRAVHEKIYYDAVAGGGCGGFQPWGSNHPL